MAPIGHLAFSAFLISLSLAPAVSTEIKFVYRTDRQIRIEWEPYSLGRVQHYDVSWEGTADRGGMLVTFGPLLGGPIPPWG